jgi:type I restriction enzyme M protein
LFFNNEEPTDKTWFYRVDIPSDRKHFSKTKPMGLKHFEDCINWWNDRKEIADEEGNPKAKCYSSQELIESGYNFDVCGYPKAEEEILSIKDTILNYKKHSEVAEEKINSTLAKISEILGIEL